MEIGQKQFKTKKEAITHFKEILNSYNFQEKVSKEHFDDIIELLKYHPSKSKLTESIDTIIVDKVKFNTKAFHYLNADGEFEAFSYLKCINGDNSAIQKFAKTCRDAVQDDIFSVKQQYFKINSNKGRVKCQETGELCKWEELVVDHRQPNTFSVIVDRFIEINSIDINSIEYIEVIDGVYKFSDDVIIEKFKNYHKEKANLRIVIKKVNSKRAHQGRLQQQKKDLKIQ